MKKKSWGLLAALFFWGTASAFAQQQTPSLTVLGHGEVQVAPDMAVVRLGAVAQAEKAESAQDRVNAAVQGLLKGLKAIGIPEERITTVELSITPVYGNQPPGPAGILPESVIIGYRASNVVKVRIQDLHVIGRVVDAGLAAGANRVEGISFGLKDDREHRRQALSLAAADARTKADAVAKAMGVQLVGVRSVSEGSGDLVRPMEATPRLTAMASAPIQPGQLQIKASLTVSYEIK